jgi:prophage regulatory protein
LRALEIMETEMNEQNSCAHTTPRGGFFRRPEVERRTGLACSTIYILSKNGKFPKQMKIGPRAVGWPVDEKERFQRSFILVIRVPFGRVRTALFDHDLDLTAANTDKYCAGLLFKILSDPVAFVDFAKAWAAGTEAAKKLRQAEEKASGRASNSQAKPKRKNKKRPQRKSRP